MPNQELIQYIKETLKQGFSDEEIKEALLKEGWGKAEVEEGFRAAGGTETAAPVPAPPQPTPQTTFPATPSEEPTKPSIEPPFGAPAESISEAGPTITTPAKPLPKFSFKRIIKILFGIMSIVTIAPIFIITFLFSENTIQIIRYFIFPKIFIPPILILLIYYFLKLDQQESQATERRNYIIWIRALIVLSILFLTNLIFFNQINNFLAVKFSFIRPLSHNIWGFLFILIIFIFLDGRILDKTKKHTLTKILLLSIIFYLFSKIFYFWEDVRADEYGFIYLYSGALFLILILISLIASYKFFAKKISYTKAKLPLLRIFFLCLPFILFSFESFFWNIDKNWNDNFYAKWINTAHESKQITQCAAGVNYIGGYRKNSRGISNSQLRTKDTQGCIANFLMNENTEVAIKECNKFQSGYHQNFCLRVLAKKHDDPKICLNHIFDDYYIGECLQRISQSALSQEAAETPGICEKMTNIHYQDQLTRNDCYLGAVRYSKDIEICNQIPIENKYDVLDYSNCARALVDELDDPQICENIKLISPKPKPKLLPKYAEERRIDIENKKNEGFNHCINSSKKNIKAIMNPLIPKYIPSAFTQYKNTEMASKYPDYTELKTYFFCNDEQLQINYPVIRMPESYLLILQIKYNSVQMALQNLNARLKNARKNPNFDQNKMESIYFGNRESSINDSFVPRIGAFYETDTKHNQLFWENENRVFAIYSHNDCIQPKEELLKIADSMISNTQNAK